MVGFADFGKDRILVHALNMGEFDLAAQCIALISVRGIYAEIADQFKYGGDKWVRYIRFLVALVRTCF